MLRLPSIGRLAGATAEVARRFPEVVACAVIAGCDRLVATDMDIDAVLLRRESAAR